MFCGVFNHVPLIGVLGIIFFHVSFVATREKVNDLVTIKHEHSGAQWGELAWSGVVEVGFGQEEFDLIFGVEEVVHLLVVRKRFISEVAAFGGRFGDLL